MCVWLTPRLLLAIKEVRYFEKVLACLGLPLGRVYVWLIHRLLLAITDARRAPRGLLGRYLGRSKAPLHAHVQVVRGKYE